MGRIGRPGLPEQERRRVWELWKAGKTYSEISRIVGVPPGSIFSILQPRGGIYHPAPTPRTTALALPEREEISRGIASGESLRAIASRLGRAPSTISREIQKNGGIAKYRAISAQHRAARRAKRPQPLKLETDTVLRDYVSEKLEEFWSPEQIAGRLRLEYPDDPTRWISHEAIYRGVYLNSVRRALPKKIHHCLRRRRPLRHSRYHTTSGQWRSQIKQACPISERPEEANQRQEPGHWEGDLIIGSNSSQVATLVDRFTRETILLQLPDRTASSLSTYLTQYLHKHPHLHVVTLTWDRGMEMAEHQHISKATGVDIYFADPQSPWQRGTNENTNGLIRQFLPKKTDLSQHSQNQLNKIAHQLNTRPRKVLGFRTPLEVETQLVALTN